ncbi:MAG: MgtC/SapB family protein [Flavobacteriia bacterium]|nr:MgtC/SapB family protein [Flavobacteriia bacterium]
MKDPILIEEIIKLVVALLIGAIIGAEREYKSKAAGFRTVILITVGSTLFTIVSNVMGADARVASNIVTGIGFLGAGAIFREGVNVKGLTTATTIWISAAIGMAIGIGKYDFAIVALVIVMLVLLSFTWIQNIIEKTNKVEIYHITIENNKETNKQTLKAIFVSCQLKARCVKHMKDHHKQTYMFTVQGPARNHSKLIDVLFNSEFIASFEA